MNFRQVLLTTVLFTQIPAFAQPVIGHVLSFGVTGGLGMTDAFADRRLTGVDVNNHFFSRTKDYIVGPTIELHLPLKLSVEFDALYRPLNLTTVNTFFSGGVSTFTTSQTLNSWEFPVLGKYHFAAHGFSPFLEAGPDFRTVHRFPNDAPHLSTAGFAAGGGAELKVGPLKIDPELRYIQWGSDSRIALSSFDPRSNNNQAEFLLGLAF